MMQRFLELLLVVLLLVVSNASSSRHRTCGTPELTVEEEGQAARAVKKWQTKKKPSARSVFTVSIDVYFHVLHEDNGSPEIPESLLLEQFHILNDRFAPTPFRFVLKEITRTQNSDWVGNTRDDFDLETEINLQLGRGGPEVMNVYFQPGLYAADLFAYASVPKWRGVYPVNRYSPNDKVVLCPDYLPGLTDDYDLGLTLVHEAGHWLGLQHPFRGSSCIPNENDFVDDTPQMEEPTYGCPRSKDSCPFIPGDDLINNYMDYSDDRCMDSFTPGQVERMLAQVAEFRLKPVCTVGSEASVKFELQFDQKYEETQWGMTHWGVSEQVTEFRHDSAYDYENAYAVYEDCLDTDSLYEFFLIDSSMNGLEAPGFAALTINGREIARVSQFETDTFSVFVSAAPVQCDGTLVFIEILFDSSPQELTWDVTNIITGQVVADHTSSLSAGDDSYFVRMADSLLHVDRCLPDGRYTMTVRDSGGNGIAAPGYWRVSTGGLVLAEGGAFDSEESRSFVIGNTLVGADPSDAPSIRSSEMPSSTPTRVPSDVPTVSVHPSGSIMPSQSPSTSPSIWTEPTPGGLCFAGSSIVEVKGRGKVPLRSVSIGDHVLTAKDNTYEPIYSFGHYGLSTHGSFLEIATENTTLLVSKDHMVFVSTVRCIPASMLSVGDQLVGKEGTSRPVVLSIKSVTARGVLAPFTPSGRIVVDGILASSFVAFQDSETLSLVGGIAFSYQWLAHSFEFPHRVICFYFGSCPNEEYIDSGISTWVAAHHEIGKWVLDQGPVKRVPLLIVVVSILLAFNFCEQYTFLASLLLIMTFWSLGRARRKTPKHKHPLPSHIFPYPTKS